ncbi:helix-turn-helix domain-containing protein [Kitasatospora sp. NPDC048365]|uniref:helix-turn-helix domain-containing protein n=1 Tax=Kitasatospora sp. NPDC048365 TaxID=3364050 RepID=UPI00371488C3
MQYYSVEQVAELLGLHVRTVRGYIREERLRATRIGKQYRIAREDLEAFTGTPAEAAPAHRHVEVSSIVRIEGIDAVAAGRLSTAALAGATGRRPDGTQLRVQTVHDAERATLQVVVLGSPGATAELLRIVELLAKEME